MTRKYKFALVTFILGLTIPSIFSYNLLRSNYYLSESHLILGLVNKKVAFQDSLVALDNQLLKPNMEAVSQETLMNRWDYYHKALFNQPDLLFIDSTEIRFGYHHGLKEHWYAKIREHLDGEDWRIRESKEYKEYVKARY